MKRAKKESEKRVKREEKERKKRGKREEKERKKSEKEEKRLLLSPGSRQDGVLYTSPTHRLREALWVPLRL